MGGTLQKKGLSWCLWCGLRGQVSSLRPGSDPSGPCSLILLMTSLQPWEHKSESPHVACRQPACGLGGLTDLLLTLQAPCGLKVPCTHRSLDPSAHLGSHCWSSAFLLNSGGWPIAWLAIPKQFWPCQKSECLCFLQGWPHLFQWDLHLSKSGHPLAIPFSSRVYHIECPYM